MDIFAFYRNMLFLILTAYTVVTTIVLIIQSGWLLTSRDRGAVILRRYLFVMFLRMRIGSFRSELVQILLLTAALVALLALHTAFPLPPA